MRSRLSLLLVIVLLVVTPAFAWEVRLDDGDDCLGLRALRVDVAGNVFALGFEYLDCHGDGRGPNFIVKIAGGTGRVVWRRELPDFLFAEVLLLDAGGNPFVGQHRHHDEDETWLRSPALVARLSGQTGEPVWTRSDVTPWLTTSSGNVLVTDESRLVELDGMDGSEEASMPFPSGARLVGAQPRGDAIAEQDVEDDPSTPSYDAFIRVSRLAWPSGDVAWSHDASYHLQRSVIDGAGNVVVAGSERANLSSPFRWFAGLLGGRSGDSRWTTVLDWTGQTAGPSGDVRAATVDGAGDVFLAGSIGFAGTSSDFAVAKLSRVDGRAVWQWSFDDGMQWDSAIAMVTDAAGDVIAVGTSGRTLASRAPVVKLTGAAGTVLWKKDTVFRNWSRWDTALLVEADAHGDVVVGGEVGEEGIAIAKLSGPTGGDFPCGNGIQDDAEACDDGNLTPNDGCESDCTPSASCDDADPCSRDALEPSGCAFEAIPGIAGQRCVLDEHYPPTACPHVPRGVRKAVERARKFLDHSLSTPGDKADLGVQRSLERAARRISRARVDDPCRNAVLALLADAAARHPL